MSGPASRLSGALPALPEVHDARFRAVAWGVESLLRGGPLTVTGLGRFGTGCSKHSIKRADRLVGNRRLFEDHEAFFKAVTKAVIPASGRVEVLVDWTKVDAEHYALVAAVPMGGRAQPILFQLHATEKHGTPAMERVFLRCLRELLEGREVVVVSDAGFRTDWFRTCESLGFQYVGRLTGYAMVWTGEAWQQGRSLADEAGKVVRDLGRTRVTKTKQHPARVIVAPKPKLKPKKRKPRCLDRAKQKAKLAAKTAWVLVSNLAGPPAELMRLYGLRMQIEESFRDTKNPRFGRSLRYSRSRGLVRVANLLLLDLLASWVLTLIGMKAERIGLHRRFQANTVRSHRVLARATLARELMRTAFRRYFGPVALAREAQRARLGPVCGDA